MEVKHRIRGIADPNILKAMLAARDRFLSKHPLPHRSGCLCGVCVDLRLDAVDAIGDTFAAVGKALHG
jgi:hypothetical protein